MGASVGTGDGDSVDVELNVVPFIDLMSCLTAFLLVSAVWSEYSQMNIKPKGIARKGAPPPEETPKNISVLLTKSEIWVGMTTQQPTLIRNESNGYDWDALGKVLSEFKETAEFTDRADLEIAAEDEVVYQSVIDAMDTSIGAQFIDIGYTDPASLSVRFKE